MQGNRELKDDVKFLTQGMGLWVTSWKLTFQAKGTGQQRFEDRKHGLNILGEE